MVELVEAVILMGRGIRPGIVGLVYSSMRVRATMLPFVALASAIRTVRMELGVVGSRVSTIAASAVAVLALAAFALVAFAAFPLSLAFWRGSEFEAYRLSQVVTVDSKDLDRVIEISREISELLEQGVQIRSYNPKFYYSDLDKLKLNLIEQASENGRIRAEQIAKNSNSSLKGLKDARLGVFQILGYNSGESYSWSGTFNTSSRWKTASITVKMDFEVE